MTNRPLLAMVAVACLAISCSVIGSTPDKPTEPGILFEDDFADPGSGWDRVSDETGLTDYADGAYRILVDEANMDYWANPGLSLADVRTEVEATKAAGSDDNDLGIICRYQDVENFYYGVISSDGFAGIFKVVDGAPSVISGDELQPSDAIKQGDSTNAIRLDCVGEALTLFVNGTRVSSATDAEWSVGDVGLIAGTYEAPGTDIYFDNFVVREP